MPAELYEPAAHEASSLDGCYWSGRDGPPSGHGPVRGDLSAEIAVIGAGITGLSAARELVRLGADVVVLDRHFPGWGASGRNGGFACIGGAKLPRARMMARYGAEDHAQYRRAEVEAVALVARTLTDLGLGGVRQSPEGEVMLAHHKAAAQDFPRLAEEMEEDYGVVPAILTPEDLRRAGLHAAGMHGGLRLPLGFAVDPHAYVQGLAAAVTAAGGRIHGGSPVGAVTAEPGGVVLATPGGTVRARRLLVATNGYLSERLFPQLAGRFLPVTSSVMVTRPLTAEERATQGWVSAMMAYDSRRLLHYFRLLPDGRFLFGMRGGIRWTPSAHAAIRRRMQRDFAAMFPAWAGVETPWFWSGLACLSRELVPYCGPVPGLAAAWAAMAYHGNGVAMGSWCGRQAARGLLAKPTDLPRMLRTRPRRFPLPRLRRVGLQAAYAVARIADGPGAPVGRGGR